MRFRESHLETLGFSKLTKRRPTFTKHLDILDLYTCFNNDPRLKRFKNERIHPSGRSSRNKNKKNSADGRSCRVATVNFLAGVINPQRRQIISDLEAIVESVGFEGEVARACVCVCEWDNFIRTKSWSGWLALRGEFRWLKVRGTG